MGKPATVKAPKEVKEAPPKPEFKFTITDLAEELDKDQAVVRVALRKLQVPKNGGRYGWNAQKEFDGVVKDVRDSWKKEPPKEKKPKKAVKEAA